MDVQNFVENPVTNVGFVDGFAELKSATARTFRVTGWALDPGSASRRPAASVVLLDEHRNVLGETRVSECRSDVATYYHDPKLTRCGWTLFMSTASLAEGDHQVTAYALDVEGRLAYRLNGSFKISVGPQDAAPLPQTEKRPMTAMENQLLNWNEQASGQAALSSYPTLVILDLTEKCNLNCVMCYRYNTDLDGHIADDVYEHVKATLFPHAERIVISSRAGEPTIYPKFSQVVQDLVDHGLQGTLITNATVLNEERIREIVDAGFEVHFSVDGATERTYQFIRGYKLWRVAEQIKAYVAYYRAKTPPVAGAWPKTIVNFTPMMVNIREVPMMVDLIADWGVEGLFVQRFSPNNAYTGKNWSPETDPVLMEQVYDEAIERAKRRGVTLVIDDILRYRPPAEDPATLDTVPDMPNLGCTRPFSDALIALDGGVSPCCLGAPAMGYLQQQTFDEIWNGDTWRELRRGLAEGDPPSYCLKCRLLKKTDKQREAEATRGITMPTPDLVQFPSVQVQA
jgi:MoaA/NifB/PqqE/SkfB family radical SAM enzyme